MNRDLKITAIIGAAPAILLAGAGLWVLTHVVQQVRQNKAYREEIERRVEASREAFEDLRNEKWKNDFTPLDANSDLFADREYTRAYLRHHSIG